MWDWRTHTYWYCVCCLNNIVVIVLCSRELNVECPIQHALMCVYWMLHIVVCKTCGVPVGARRGHTGPVCLCPSRSLWCLCNIMDCLIWLSLMACVVCVVIDVVSQTCIDVLQIYCECNTHTFVNVFYWSVWCLLCCVDVAADRMWHVCVVDEMNTDMLW